MTSFNSEEAQEAAIELIAKLSTSNKDNHEKIVLIGKVAEWYSRRFSDSFRDQISEIITAPSAA
jgi:hypothetical protein